MIEVEWKKELPTENGYYWLYEPSDRIGELCANTKFCMAYRFGNEMNIHTNGIIINTETLKKGWKFAKAEIPNAPKYK